MWRIFCFVVFLCAVVNVNCRKYNSDRNVEYSRNKRAKYYFPPTYKYYNRPSYNSYNRGPFQYNPSYGYSTNDIGPQVSSKQRPYKVSKRPFNEGLGDEGFQIISQYLSNSDLDKIIELAIERETNSDKYLTLDPLDNDAFNAMYFSNNENNLVFKNNDYDDDNHKYFNGLSAHFNNKKYHDLEYQSSYANYPHKYAQEPAIDSVYNPIPIHNEPAQDERFTSLDAHIQRDVNEINPDNNNIFTDESTMQEERLPKPVNLREDDYDISSSNNKPAFAKPETSYKLESFADLPLTEFENSKLDTVNSYSVPQYSVTSSNNRRPPVPSSRPLPPSSPPSLSSSILTLINAPEVEPAPPSSVAKEQSDAHLKATNIWTHKSKGTAYTLHDDGTLSLERPSKPKYNFP